MRIGLRLIEVEMDRDRAGFLLTVYGRDGKSPEDYDLHLDTTGVPFESGCRKKSADTFAKRTNWWTRRQCKGSG